MTALESGDYKAAPSSSPTLLPRPPPLSTTQEGYANAHPTHQPSQHPNPEPPPQAGERRQPHRTPPSTHPQSNPLSNTRAHWFKTRVLCPTQHPTTRQRSSATIARKHRVRFGTWNTTGMLESGKLHTITHHMKTRKLGLMFLTETHCKQPDTFTSQQYCILLAIRSALFFLSLGCF